MENVRLCQTALPSMFAEIKWKGECIHFHVKCFLWEASGVGKLLFATRVCHSCDPTYSWKLIWERVKYCGLFFFLSAKYSGLCNIVVSLETLWLFILFLCIYSNASEIITVVSLQFCAFNCCSPLSHTEYLYKLQVRKQDLWPFPACPFSSLVQITGFLAFPRWIWNSFVFVVMKVKTARIIIRQYICHSGCCHH